MALFDFFRKKQNNSSDVSREIQNIIGSGTSVVNNRNFEEFKKFSQINSVVANRSVIDNNLDQVNPSIPYSDVFNAWFDEINAVPLLTNKSERIKQYRRISALPECDWCLEQIASDFIHENESGEYIRLNLPVKGDNLSDLRREIIQNEFRKFIDMFELRDNGFHLMKRFLVEGELTWENIIDIDCPERGIIGLKFIPAEYYETLVNKNTGERIGLDIDTEQQKQDIRMILSQNFYNSRQIFNNMIGINNYLFKENCVPMLWPQITYINSNDFSPDGLTCFPLIEKSKQAYYQYILMKESAVILRVTRAPERLLFNVSTGNLPPRLADERVRKFANSLRQRKSLDAAKLDSQTEGLGGTDSPGMANHYNPITMLETFIFGKSNANDGTTIDTVNSTAQYDQIDDLKYFQKLLLKQFNVPWSRLEAPDQMNEQSDSLSYEEYTFSRMLIRLQRRFSIGLKNSFITHLKLRGIFDKYELKKSDIDIVFTPPVLYDITQRQKLMETKIAAYAALGDREEFSKTIAMKKILGMSEEEIKENFTSLAKERVWFKYAEFCEGQVGEEGKTPNKIVADIDKEANPIEAEPEKKTDTKNGEEEEEGEEVGVEEPPEEGGMEGEGAMEEEPLAPEAEPSEEEPEPPI